MTHALLAAAAAPLGRPLDASLDGFRNDALFYVTTVMVAVLFVIMVGILGWTVVMHRAGRGRARYEHGIGRRHLVFTALITAVIFFAVDGTLLVDSYVDLARVVWKFPGPAAHPVRIEVWAQQWSWNVRYPGPDGQFGTPDDIVTLDEMHVPLGRPVVVHLKAKDVVHSFWLPNFRIKQDAMPGFQTRVWFEATRAGRYEIGCAQFCGVSHNRMQGWLVAEPAADFAAWQARLGARAKAAYDPDDADAHWGWPWM